MKPKIYSQSSDLESISENIERLYQQCSSPNPYFCSDWITIWWKHFGKDSNPRILTLWNDENDQLLAFWPLYEVKAVSGTALWPMLYNVADYFDPLIHPDNHSKVAEHLIQLFLKETKHYAYIWTLVIRTDFYQLLQPFSDKKKNKQLLNKSKQRFFIELSDENYESFIEKKLGTKSRKTLRYTERKLQEGDPAEFLDLVNKDEIEPLLPILCEVEQASWKASEGIGIFAMPGLRAFFFELLPILSLNNKIRISIVKKGDEVIAYQLGLIAPNYYGLNNLTYKQRYHELSPGRHLLLHTLKTTFEEKRTIFDFMIGDQEYKQKFATHNEPLLALHLFQKSIKGWINRKAIEANMKARQKI